MPRKGAFPRSLRQSYPKSYLLKYVSKLKQWGRNSYKLKLKWLGTSPTLLVQVSLKTSLQSVILCSATRGQHLISF